MRVGGLSSGEIALQLLTRLQNDDSRAPAAPSFGVATSPLGMTDAYGRASSTAISAIQDLAASAASSAEDAVAKVKAWAKSPLFRNAAKGVADDQLRAAIRDGQLPHLPQLDEAQLDRLSESEKMIYGTVRTLQDLYEAQPKSLEQALADHVKSVIEGYPESIARMKQGVATGQLKVEDGWDRIIADYETELDAARQGKMQIHAVDDPALMRAKEEFTVDHNSFGWSGRGITINADIPALQSLLQSQHVLPGGSPYTGTYAITW